MAYSDAGRKNYGREQVASLRSRFKPEKVYPKREYDAEFTAEQRLEWAQRNKEFIAVDQYKSHNDPAKLCKYNPNKELVVDSDM